MTILSAFQEICQTAGVDAWVHARTISGDREWGIGDTDTVVTASVYKTTVLLELACQYDEGAISPTQRVTVPASRRTLGPSGISAMLDEVEMSVRDLAFLMMSVSDNTATDVLQALVGTDRINERLRALGINSTYIRDDCASLLAEVIADLGGDPTLPVPESSTPANPFELDDAALREAITTSPALTGKTGNTSTPRDITTLLSLIWSDRAGSPEACAEVRRIMGLQFAPHRLSTAYGDGPSISGKTGTLVGGITNEAGVIDFGNGEAYAVAVFLRKHDFSLRNAAGDRAVGDLARLVIDSLRS